MRPPVLPSASMTILIAVAGVAIYWITAAVRATAPAPQLLEIRSRHDF